MDEQPKRSWYRFSLRTLLLGIVFLSILLGWLGWQSRIVLRRRAMMNEIQQAGGSVWTLDFSADPKKEDFAKQTDISWVRRAALGDRAASGIVLPRDKFLSDEDIKRIKDVLPEARVVRR